MSDRAPAVVAVVVTTGAAPGLEATVASLAGQDYAQLSVLVVANDAEGDVAARVAAVAPTAFVRVLAENRGFAAACNEAALMVEGAAFLLFCHDDVLLQGDAVSHLVESSFRNNAGVVTPKVVAYDDPAVLVHVGQVADRFGTVRERVQVGEVDQGQQDLERDVFVAPGGVTLVRTDLFETLAGFDPLIPVIGEDLDLCWRAQVAGARIVVAPSAVVAHRQTVATGERPVTAVGTRQASRMALQRRHQLATVLTCWSAHTLLVVVPLLVALDGGELVVAMVGRDRDRARAILGAWRWVLRNRRHLRSRRRELDRIRVLRDVEVLRLQVGGASRLRTFFVTLLQDGLDRARGMRPEIPREVSAEESAGVGFASGFLDDEEYEELESTPVRRWRLGRAFLSGRSQLALVAVAVVVWLVASRDLVATALPVIGRLTPLSSWWEMWRHFFASWSPNGVGTGTPAMPGYGVLAFFGTFVFGRMGILPRVALLGAVPAGALGVWRLGAGWATSRGRLAAALAYVALPLAANLTAGGRVDTLVVVAVLPFAVRRALALVNAPGFRLRPLGPDVRFGARGFGAARGGQTALLTIQVALMTALAPSALIAVELVILGAVLAAALGRLPQLDRPLRLAAVVFVGTAVLLLPMTFDAFAAGPRLLEVFGLPTGPWAAPSLGALVRGALGPFGDGWGAWVLPGIALAGVALARGARRGVALTLVGVAAVAAAVAVLADRHWLGDFAPDATVLAVVVAMAVATLVGLTVSVVESELTPWTGRWRTGVTWALALALVVAVLPWLAQSRSGRFDLPTTGTSQTLVSIAPTKFGGYRILWLGEPDALPVPGWSVVPGLAAATTTNALPAGSTMFAAPDPGAATALLTDVDEALTGRTVELGQLLAAEGVSTVVVMTAAAPTLAGVQRVGGQPPPAALVPSLRRQQDLALTAHTAGVYLYSNVDFHGIISVRAAPLPPGETAANPSSVQGWTPVMAYRTRQGYVPAGTVMAALAPASAFELTINGREQPRSTSLGGVAVFRTKGGEASLVLHQLPLNAALAALTLLLWVALTWGFGGRDLVTWWSRRRAAPADEIAEDAP